MASSLESDQDAAYVFHCLRPWVRLLPVHGTPTPRTALSYVLLPDGRAGLLRRFDGAAGPGRNDSHLLLAPRDVLTSDSALALHGWAGWLDGPPSDARLARAVLNPDDFATDGLRARSLARPDLLQAVLARCLAAPEAVVGVVNCPEENKIGMLWGLRALLTSTGRQFPDWMFSTYEVDTRDLRKASGLVFLPVRPQLAFPSPWEFIDLDQLPVPHSRTDTHTQAARLVQAYVSGQDLSLWAETDRYVLPRAETAPAAPPDVIRPSVRVLAGRPLGLPGPPRHALTIGVAEFGDGADPDSDDTLEPLHYAPALVDELGEELDGLGFRTSLHPHDRFSGASLGAVVGEQLTSVAHDEVLVVHVISHGHSGAGGGTVYALGSDTAPDSGADVGRWLTDVENLADRPLTLFLLDLCFSGTLARLPWQAAVESESARAWVIAACQPHEVAYDGRFTRAVVSVLRAIRAGDLDISPTSSHVPLAAFARAVRQEVNRLADAADANRQTVTASAIDMSADPELPFFPNPAYRPDSRLRLRALIDPGLMPFLDDLDEGLDASHFIERATGAGRLAEHTGGLVGCFSGRDRELRQASPWINGFGRGSLCIVTGSPGVGKSALLGVLVCAAHDLLRDTTKPVWERVAQAPHPVESLAAVHARRRSLAAVVASVARQLSIDTDEEELTASTLVERVSALARPPVLVLDALDEAEAPRALLDELLLPLVAARRHNGSASARVVVGVRPYPDFEPLFAVARDSGLLIDLDDVAPHVLEDDLYAYVIELLRSTTYRRHNAAAGAFAGEVARVLSEPAGDREWGPFLVAGLYARHLLLLHSDPATLDVPAALELGAAVPLGLPAVLELDLDQQADTHPWLRPMMTALAHAKGQGMPLSVLFRTARLFAPQLPELSPAGQRDALAAAKFYLRQTSDVDGTTVYRLFHQALVDHLVSRPLDGPPRDRLSGAMLDALLAPLGGRSDRDWDTAEPYVLRHALEHAVAADRVDELMGDLGYLVRPEVRAQLDSLDPADDDRFAWIARLFRGLGDEPVSAGALALQAARNGQPALAAVLSDRVDPPTHWRPVWTFGEAGAGAEGEGNPLGWSRVHTLPNHPSPVAAVWLAPDGNSALAFHADGPLRTWNVDRPLASVAFPPAATPALLVGADGAGGPPRLIYAQKGSLLRQDLSTGRRHALQKAHPARIVAVAVRGSRVFSLSADGTARIEQSGRKDAVVVENAPRARLYSAVWADQPWLAYVDGGGVRLWNASTGADRLVCSPDGGVAGVVLAGNATTVLVLGLDEVLRLWSVEGVELWHGRLTSWPRQVACSPDGRFVAAGHADGTVQLWATGGLSEPIELAVSHQEVSALAVAGDGTVLVADVAGDTQVWRPGAEQPGRAAARAMSGAGEVTAFMVTDDLIQDELIVLAGTSSGEVVYVNGERSRREVVTTGKAPVASFDIRQVGGRRVVQVSWRDGAHLLLAPWSEMWVDVTAWSGLRTSSQVDADRRSLFVDDDLVEVRGGVDGSLVVVTVGSTEPAHPLTPGHDGAVTSVLCRHLFGRPTAFTGGAEGTVRVWDLVDRVLVDSVSVPGPVSAVDSAANGHLLVLVRGELVAFRHRNHTAEGSTS